MNLTELLNAIGSIEGNGAELKAWLKSFLAEKDAATVTAESLVNSAESRVNSVAKALNCEPDKLLDAVKTLQGQVKEIDNYKTTEQTLKAKVTELEAAKKASDRASDLKDFCAIVGADFKAVSKLLPPDLEFKQVVKKGEDNKDLTVGVVVSDGKEVSFADYVDADDNLKTFRASIFTQPVNPPVGGVKLPSGKSSDKPTTDALGITQSLQQQQAARAAKLLESRI